jgi:exosome complex component CSL4
LIFKPSIIKFILTVQISHKYIEKISDAFQITDIVRFKVIGQKENEYILSTVGKDLGVIHADCSICGTPLDKIGFNKLRCSRCGNVESRMIASDYRNVNQSLRY